MRRLLFWLLFIAFLWFVGHRLPEIHQITQTLARGHGGWLALAAIFAFGHYLAYTQLYKIAFEAIGLPFVFRELFVYVVAALAVNAATPTGGAANTLLFMDYASQRDHSPGKAGAGSLMAFLTGIAVLLVMLFFTFIYLANLDRLETFEVVGYVILSLILLAVAVIMWFGIRQPQRLLQLFQWFRQIINRVGKIFGNHQLITNSWLNENSSAFTTAAETISHHQRAFGRMIGVVLLMYLTDLLALAALFRAYDQLPTLPMLLASYFVGQLFWIVSPTPQGIGVVEGVMAVIISSFGLHLSQATVIALAFRGLDFWLPLLIGFFLLRRLHSFDRLPDEAD